MGLFRRFLCDTPVTLDMVKHNRQKEPDLIARQQKRKKAISMLTMREEELNMVNGGTVFGTVFGEMLGGSKFNVGDRVISKSEPELGVGVVEEKNYDKGWHYSVAMAGGTLHTYEDDLEYPIM